MLFCGKLTQISADNRALGTTPLLHHCGSVLDLILNARFVAIVNVKRVAEWNWAAVPPLGDHIRGGAIVPAVTVSGAASSLGSIAAGPGKLFERK